MHMTVGVHDEMAIIAHAIAAALEDAARAAATDVIVTAMASLSAPAVDDLDVLVIGPSADAADVLDTWGDRTRCVVTAEEPRAIEARSSLLRGASAYVAMAAAPSELLAAVAASTRGDRYVDPAVISGLLLLPPLRSRTVDPHHVAPLLADGRRNGDIADQLGVPVAAVRRALQQLHEWAGTTDRAALVVHLLREQGAA